MGTLYELPQREPVYVETAGRFGDWREPLARELAETGPLCRAAESRRLDPGIALTLLVERSLVLDDLRWLGHDVEAARTVLDLEAADQPPVVPGPGRPNAGYARTLNGLGSAGARDLRGIPSLPARLLDRVDDARVEAVLDESPLTVLLAEAVAWERAALAAGRSMGEWALLVLLAAR